jgi:hypothetical protein
VLTPEERVRQNMLAFLHLKRDYPLSLMAVEQGLKVNGMQRRADVVVYSKGGEPVLLIECKAPAVKLNQAVFDQAARYNLTFRVPYLVITNGTGHYCSKIDFEKKQFTHLDDIPMYDELV